MARCCRTQSMLVTSRISRAWAWKRRAFASSTGVRPSGRNASGSRPGRPGRAGCARTPSCSSSLRRAPWRARPGSRTVWRLTRLICDVEGTCLPSLARRSSSTAARPSISTSKMARRTPRNAWIRLLHDGAVLRVVGDRLEGLLHLADLVRRGAGGRTRPRGGPARRRGPHRKHVAAWHASNRKERRRRVARVPAPRLPACGLESLMAEPGPPALPAFQVQSSRHFAALLAAQRMSLAFTTYQTRQAVPHRPASPTAGSSIFERTFNRCMGLWADGQTLWMSSLYQLWRFENVAGAGRARTTATTGSTCRGSATPPATSTSTTSPSTRRPGRLRQHAVQLPGHASANRDSFTPLWRPPFVQQAGRRGPLPPQRPGPGGRPAALRHAPSAARDVADGWRDRRRDGGVRHRRARAARSSSRACRCRTRRAGTAAGSGCSTPAPGYLGRVDLARGRVRAGGLLPGLPARPGVRRRLRGGRPVAAAAQQDLQRPGAGRGPDRRAGAEPRCGLQVIDLRTGDAVALAAA